MTDKHVLFGRKQSNKGIKGDESIIKIFHFHGNESSGMLVKNLIQKNNTVQKCWKMCLKKKE